MWLKRICGALSGQKIGETEFQTEKEERAKVRGTERMVARDAIVTRMTAQNRDQIRDPLSSRSLSIFPDHVASLTDIRENGQVRALSSQLERSCRLTRPQRSESQVNFSLSFLSLTSNFMTFVVRGSGKFEWSGEKFASLFCCFVFISCFTLWALTDGRGQMVHSKGGAGSHRTGK